VERIATGSPGFKNKSCKKLVRRKKNETIIINTDRPRDPPNSVEGEKCVSEIKKNRKLFAAKVAKYFITCQPNRQR